MQAVGRHLETVSLCGNMSVISDFTLECEDIPQPWRCKSAFLLFHHEPIIVILELKSHALFVKGFVSVPADISMILHA